MQGPIQALVKGILLRGLSPALLPVMMAAPARKAARAQLKKIYVLDDRGEMAGEYILDADCPIDYDDFLKVLPPEGIGDRDSLFVGEYVFTAFQSGKVVFVLLSRGHLASEDVDWTALLLTAADSHLDRKSTRLNSSHTVISYAVFCLKKKTINEDELKQAFDQISAELSQQYILSYYPDDDADKKGAFRNITLAVKGRTNLTVRTRKGY